MKPLRLTEERMRDSLLKGRSALIRGGISPKLSEVLKENFPTTYESALLLDSVPEQGEDIYTILIDKELILEVEISRRRDSVELIRKVSLKEWASEGAPMGRTMRRKLEMALTLQPLDGSHKPDDTNGSR